VNAVAGQTTRTVVLVQARMGSTRLPGKALADICGRTMLERVVLRASRATRPDEVVVATTTRPEDDAVAAEATRLGVPAFRGEPEDVLDRFTRAAEQLSADVVVRVTADCPFLDPGVLDDVTDAFANSTPPADLASNVVERTYPRGLDVEVLQISALQIADREARLPHQRSHVTPYLYEHPDRFRLVSVRGNGDFAHERWTVDTPEDLRFARELCTRLPDPDGATWRDALAVLENEPQLRAINSRVHQKTALET
jgi:spore coat polysaccharide biosynthesis protein SpsF